MKAVYITSAISSVLWALILLMGIVLIKGVYSQNVSGYPNSSQLTYYIAIPAIVLTLSAAVLISAIRFRYPKLWLMSLAISLAVVPYFFFYTGGV